ncbi:hypothetical protein [Putridiphycobacter roseus]|nr:hypothetical protein [Putridiphycobacter roseus]
MRSKTFLFLLLSFLFSITRSFSQEKKEDKLKFGVLLESNYSKLYAKGLTPSLTLKYKKNELNIGPRIPYSLFVNNNKNINIYGVDLVYKRYLFDFERIHLFTGIHSEIIQTRFNDTWYYEYQPLISTPATGLYLGPDPKNVRSEFKKLDFTLNLIVGMDYNLTKHLYLSTSFGFGFRADSKYSNYFNSDTGELFYNINNEMHVYALNWIGSAGIGYRFGK